MSALIIFIIGIILIALSVSVVYFLSPKLSPIPYFPTNKKDVDKIVSILLKRKRSGRHTIIDLGAGTGRVVFGAAKQAFNKKLAFQFIAVEINPAFILIMAIRRFFSPNKKNVAILRKNMFNIDLQENRIVNKHLTIYLYISPWHMMKLLKRLNNAPKDTRVISYMYKIEKLKNKLVRIHRGINPIYEYNI